MAQTDPTNRKTNAPRSRRSGWLKWIIGVVVLVAFVKGCSAYRNRPAALYERWLGGPVPEDVTDLKGKFQFQLTESFGFLSFKAPPARIAAIVSENGFQWVEPNPPWQVESTSRQVRIGSYTGPAMWFQRSKPFPPDQEVYWQGRKGDDPMNGGWALYYRPSTQEAFMSLESF
jgi:hypothetical protein